MSIINRLRDWEGHSGHVIGESTHDEYGGAVSCGLIVTIVQL